MAKKELILSLLALFPLVPELAAAGEGGPYSECLFPDIDSCRVEPGSTCRCPCLPKCCPAGHALEEADDGIHGVTCVPVPPSGGDLRLPEVELTGRLPRCSNVSQSDLRFYHSVFPSCEGMPGGDGAWSYQVHRDGFRLNADYQQEYVLHLQGGHQGARQMVSNFANLGERSGRAAARLASSSTTVVGFKPLMHFCFDRLGVAGDGGPTVAVTCPKVPLDRARKILKCCPPGQTYSDANLDSCSPAASSNGTAAAVPWFLPINGHLYSQQELEREGVLLYRKEKIFNRTEVASKCQSKPGFSLHEEHDTFHVGADGLVHFTDNHLDVGDLGDFCVDQLHEEDYSGNTGGSHEHGSCEESLLYDDYPYYYYDEHGERTDPPDEEDYHPGDGGHGDELSRMANYDCHNDRLKPHSMVALYCKEDIVQLRKCCELGQNLNLRARSCTEDLVAGRFDPPPVYALDPATGRPAPLGDDANVTVNLLPLNIPNMDTAHLHVSAGPDYKLLVDGRLWFGGRPYPPGRYCLDYSIDYCDGRPSATLRAVLDDAGLAGAVATAIFGTNKEDSATSLLIKRAGYPVSILFLTITLSVFLVVPELRKDLHGKMVICIVSSQLVVYLCLFIGTFPSYAVSRTNWKCILQASATYYCVLCSFCWMSAMSYNIMSKFRASTILPKDADRRRFAAYSAFCFGLPSAAAAAVVALDRSVDFRRGAAPQRWSAAVLLFRPGFGEESCWFTSCSKSLSLFLYGPICLMLLSNLAMFAFAALKLNNMRKRVQKGNRRAEYGRSISTAPLTAAAPTESESESWTSAAVPDGNPETLAKRFVRQISSLSGAAAGGGPQQQAARRRSKYKANRESLSTYMKLFSAMGLTWTVEVAAWALSDADRPAPQAVIIVLNVLNIFQGLIIFLVFTMKPATAHKLQERFRRSRTKNKGKGARPRSYYGAGNNNSSGGGGHGGGGSGCHDGSSAAAAELSLATVSTGGGDPADAAAAAGVSGSPDGGKAAAAVRYPKLPKDL